MMWTGLLLLHDPVEM